MNRNNYEDLHQSTGRFDCCKRQQRLVELGFVLANPPFNVDAVDKERLAAEQGIAEEEALEKGEKVYGKA